MIWWILILYIEEQPFWPLHPKVYPPLLLQSANKKDKHEKKM
jgi:hypothetical protein